MNKIVFNQYVTSTVVNFINFLISILIARELEVLDFSDFSFAISLITFAAYISSFGFSGLIQKYIPKFSQFQSEELTSQLLVLRLLFLTLLLLMFLYLNNYFDFMDFGQTILVSIAVFLGAFNSLVSTGYLIISLKQDFVYRNVIISSIVKIIVIYIAIYQSTFDVFSALFAIVVYELSLFLLTLRKYRFHLKHRLFKFTKIVSESTPFFKEKVYELLILPLVGILYFKTFGSEVEVANYAFVFSMSFILANNVSILSKLEVVVNSFVIGRPISTRLSLLLYGVWLKGFLIVAIPVVVTLFAFYQEVGEMIFDGKYEQVMFLLPISIGFILLSHLSYLYSPILYKRGDLFQFPKASNYAGLAHLLGLVVLGYFYGVVGAIISLLISHNIKSLYFMAIYRGIVEYKSVIKLSTISLISSLFVMNLILIFFRVDTIFSLIFVSFIGFLLSISIAIMFKPYTQKEIRLIRLILL